MFNASDLTIRKFPDFIRIQEALGITIGVLSFQYKWVLLTNTQYYKDRCLAMAVTRLSLLPSNSRLLCLLDIRVNVLSSVHSDLLGRYSN
jgi:hypothetical protein